jgi:hypothetical protein
MNRRSLFKRFLAFVFGDSIVKASEAATASIFHRVHNGIFEAAWFRNGLKITSSFSSLDDALANPPENYTKYQNILRPFEEIPTRFVPNSFKVEDVNCWPVPKEVPKEDGRFAERLRRHFENGTLT